MGCLIAVVMVVLVIAMDLGFVLVVMLVAGCDLVLSAWERRAARWQAAPGGVEP